ncbi:MAG: hypothetical protein HY700_16210 [Gemmatimonadetes bacterium]|nr:hypothetical protein [Gemmatimonadota bacterium]
MKSVHTFLLLAAGLAASTACNDDALKSKTPGEPPPLTQGVQAFVQVDNDQAQPGERINVYVRVQTGTESQAKVGSYTGRLKFDPELLSWVSDAQIDDGLRVVNPNGSANGEIRFAGASAAGFNDLQLYHGVFEVKKAGYTSQLGLQMEELSAAVSLGDLKPQLQVTPQVFLRVDQ